MLWMETVPMEERRRFVEASRSRAWAMTELCERFSVSRKTGYKWLRRYRTTPEQPLTDLSRWPLGRTVGETCHSSFGGQYADVIERSIESLLIWYEGPRPGCGRRLRAGDADAPPCQISAICRAGAQSRSPDSALSVAKRSQDWSKAAHMQSEPVDRFASPGQVTGFAELLDI